jgi:hypothetical protein
VLDLTVLLPHALQEYNHAHAAAGAAEALALLDLQTWEGCVVLLGFHNSEGGSMQMLLQQYDWDLWAWAAQLNRWQTGWQHIALR